MSTADFTDRRTTFDAVALQYDDARPAYPEQLIHTVLTYAGVHEGARALEIGAGTGQATLQFAWRGIGVHAVEPGPAMADLIRERFDGTDLDVTVETADLESAVIQPGAYDLVFAATSWHWLTPVVRWQRVSEALRPGGTVAAFWHVPHWRRTDLRQELDVVYANSGADLTQMGPMADTEIENAAFLRDWVADVHDPSAFNDFRGAEYRWSQRLDAADYTSLLGTYGDHLALDPDVRSRLFEGVTAVIDAHGGQLELHYTTHLMVARAAG